MTSFCWGPYTGSHTGHHRSFLHLDVRISGSRTTMVKIQHLVSLFTLFCNNLVSVCEELRRNSDIKVERTSHL